MTSVEDTRRRIWRLIEKHEPAKLDSVNGLMKKWKGNEHALNRMLSGKFKEKLYPQLAVPLKKKYAVGKKTGSGGFVIARQCKQRRDWKDQIIDERMEKERKKEEELEEKLEAQQNKANKNLKHRHKTRIKQEKKMPKLSLKIIKKVNLEPDDMKLLDKEINILRDIWSHECYPSDTADKKKKREALGTNRNIVQLYDVFDSKHRICLVMDYLDGGELFDRIIEQGNFTEAAAARVFRQVMEALNFLHNLGIAHRDLRPENLVFASKKPKAPLKLIDFSLAKQVKGQGLTLACGTPNYVAPEIIRRHPYDTQVDMWSAGVILYLLLCGFPPFYDKHDNLRRLYRKIRHAEVPMPSPYWDNISSFAQDMVHKLLIADPRKRMDAKTALKHPWLTGKAADTKLDEGQIANLRRFQYVRRFKRGVHTVIAVLKLIGALENAQDYMHQQEMRDHLKKEKEKAAKMMDMEKQRDENEFLATLELANDAQAIEEVADDDNNNNNNNNDNNNNNNPDDDVNVLSTPQNYVKNDSLIEK